MRSRFQPHPLRHILQQKCKIIIVALNFVGRDTPPDAFVQSEMHEMAQWQNGKVALHHGGTTSQRCNGRMVIWQIGTLTD